MPEIRFQQSRRWHYCVVEVALVMSSFRPTRSIMLRILTSRFVFVGIPVVNVSSVRIMLKCSVYHLSAVVNYPRPSRCGERIKKPVVCLYVSSPPVFVYISAIYKACSDNVGRVSMIARAEHLPMRLVCFFAACRDGYSSNSFGFA